MVHSFKDFDKVSTVYYYIIASGGIQLFMLPLGVIQVLCKAMGGGRIYGSALQRCTVENNWWVGCVENLTLFIDF